MSSPEPVVQQRVLVVMPTYNERENLTAVLTRLREAVPDAHVLVVDDGSPDGTGQIAEDIAGADDHVHVVHRPGKAGLGPAYLAGFDWGVSHGFEVLVEMDADGSHRPEDLPRMLDALDGADLVLGSRWVPGGAVVNWPTSRKVISRGGTAYARLALGVPIRDVTGGFRAFRRETLLKLDLHNVASQGYCFQVDLLWRAVQRGLRVVEVPITFVEREHGVSKMNGAIVREAVTRVTVWGLRHRVAQLGRLARSASGREAGVGAERGPDAEGSAGSGHGPDAANGLHPEGDTDAGRGPEREG